MVIFSSKACPFFLSSEDIDYTYYVSDTVVHWNKKKGIIKRKSTRPKNTMNCHKTTRGSEGFLKDKGKLSWMGRETTAE